MKVVTKAFVLIVMLCTVTFDASKSHNVCLVNANDIYNYEDVFDKTIEWEDIFNIDSKFYFVFIYSPYCGHCLEIKNIVIHYAFCGIYELRFVVANQEVPIGSNTELTIGGTAFEQIWIRGYPSLLKIENGVLCMNIAGSSEIRRVFQEMK